MKVTNGDIQGERLNVGVDDLLNEEVQVHVSACDDQKANCSMNFNFSGVTINLLRHEDSEQAVTTIRNYVVCEKFLNTNALGTLKF